MQIAYLLTVVIVGRLYHPDEKDLLALCVVAAVVSVIGIFQFYGWDFLGLTPESISYQVGTLLTMVSTMSNRNILSTYLCLAFCSGIVLCLNAAKKRLLVLLPVCWIIFYMLVLGDTESGYVGFVFAAALLLPFIIDNRKKCIRLSLLAAGCLLLFVPINYTYQIHEWYFSFHFIVPYAAILGIVFLAIALIIRFLPFLRIQKKIAIIGWYAILLAIVVAIFSILPKNR